MRHTIFGVGLRGRQLIISLKFELAVFDVINRICAPIFRIVNAASRTAAAAPLIGEDDFRAVIIKRRGMPIGKFGRDNFVYPLGF